MPQGRSRVRLLRTQQHAWLVVRMLGACPRWVLPGGFLQVVEVMWAVGEAELRSTQRTQQARVPSPPSGFRCRRHVTEDILWATKKEELARQCEEQGSSPSLPSEWAGKG